MSKSFVYFIENTETGRIKIGKSDDIDKRMESLQTGNDCALKLIGYIEGGNFTEKCIHKRFDNHRVRGEWFDASVLSEVHLIIGGEIDPTEGYTPKFRVDESSFVEAVRFLTVMKKDFERQAEIDPGMSLDYLQAAKRIDSTIEDIKSASSEILNDNTKS